MERYRNLGRNSGVHAYELTDTSITVQFTDGWCYLYTHTSSGVSDVAHMHRLAQQGRGLNSFIMRQVKDGWERKWH